MSVGVTTNGRKNASSDFAKVYLQNTTGRFSVSVTEEKDTVRQVI